MSGPDHEWVSMTEAANVLEMNGESYRLNQSRKRQDPTAD